MYDPLELNRIPDFAEVGQLHVHRPRLTVVCDRCGREWERLPEGAGFTALVEAPANICCVDMLKTLLDLPR